MTRKFDGGRHAPPGRRRWAYVDGIQVTDNPYAWVQMSALSAARILIGHGIDPVPILTCRDRNRVALKATCWGLQALGVASLMLMRGHRVPKNHSVPASTVFDLTGRELIALAASRRGETFFIGTGARVFRPGPRWQAESLAPGGMPGRNSCRPSCASTWISCGST